MGFLDNLGGGMSGMLQTPEGQEMVKKFLSSPDGENMIIGYISTLRERAPWFYASRRSGQTQPLAGSKTDDQDSR